MGILKSLKSRSTGILGPLKVEVWKMSVCHDSLGRWASRHFLVKTDMNIEAQRRNERRFLALGLPLPNRPPSIEIKSSSVGFDGDGGGGSCESDLLSSSSIITRDSLFYTKCKECFSLLFSNNPQMQSSNTFHSSLKELINSSTNWTHVEIALWVLRSCRYLGNELPSGNNGVSHLFIRRCFHIHRTAYPLLSSSFLSTDDGMAIDASNVESTSFQWGHKDGPLAMILLQVFSREYNYPLTLCIDNLLLIVEEMEKTLEKCQNFSSITNFHHLLSSLIGSRFVRTVNSSQDTSKLDEALQALRNRYFVNK